MQEGRHMNNIIDPLYSGLHLPSIRDVTCYADDSPWKHTCRGGIQ